MAGSALNSSELGVPTHYPKSSKGEIAWRVGITGRIPHQALRHIWPRPPSSHAVQLGRCEPFPLRHMREGPVQVHTWPVFFILLPVPLYGATDVEITSVTGRTGVNPGRRLQEVLHHLDAYGQHLKRAVTRPWLFKARAERYPRFCKTYVSFSPANAKYLTRGGGS